jgi:hypothetical protein
MPLDVAIVTAAPKSATASTASKAASSLIKEHSASEVLADQIKRAYDQTLQDTGLSAYNAVKALLADALKRKPSDPEIGKLMEEAAQSAHFPARAVRLIEAARKSGSTRRPAPTLSPASEILWPALFAASTAP